MEDYALYEDKNQTNSEADRKSMEGFAQRDAKQ